MVPTSEAPSPAPTSAGRPQTILVVDDEPDLRDALKQLLEDTMKDVRVLTAPGGRAALDALATESVDLIITDYKMPEMDGLQFLAQARQKAPRAARVLITAFPDVQLAINACNDAGIENFFTKPFVPGKVVTVVRELLAERRKEREQNLEFARSFEALRKKAWDQRKPG